MQMTQLTAGQRLRSMWSKKRSSFLLIRCSPGGIKSFTIPIPLWVIDTTLEAVADLAMVGDLFLRMGGKRLNLNFFVRMSIELINELRRYGRWQMMRVETEKAKVYIDFW